MTGRSWLLPDHVREMKKDIWDGLLSDTDIAVKYLVGKSTVSHVRHGRAHPNVPWPDGSIGMLSDERYVRLQQEVRRQRVIILQSQGKRVRTPIGMMIQPTALVEPKKVDFISPDIKDPERRVFEIGWRHQQEQAKEDGVFDPADYTDEKKEEEWRVYRKQSERTFKENANRKKKEAEKAFKKHKRWMETVGNVPVDLSDDEETPEEKKEYGRRHMFDMRRGGAFVPEMFIQGEFTKEEVEGMLKDPDAYNWRRHEKAIRETQDAQDELLTRIAAEKEITNGNE